MIQKVLRVGTSAATTIPKKALSELGINIGDSVSVSVDNSKKLISIKPIKSVKQISARNRHIAKLTLGFIRRYKKDLEALAKK